MRDFLGDARRDFQTHRYGLSLFALLAAATTTGLSVVIFMRAFEVISHRGPIYASWGFWSLAAAPMMFWVSSEIILRAAPWAAGTGIPQAVFASKNLTAHNEASLSPLYSAKTLLVKTFCLFLALAAGASAGREGPSVHVGMCVFMLVLEPFRRWGGLSLDPRSAVVAGGAAGLAAAFNTPLAGVTFAIEELVTDYFASVKDYVLMAIIVAGIAAKYLYGDYSYFGRLSAPPAASLSATVAISVVCGGMGILFSRAILRGQSYFVRQRAGRRGFLVPVSLALGVLSMAAIGGNEVFGPGNGMSQSLLLGEFSTETILFPLSKAVATLCTFWSGVGGGIFAPSLSIGSAAGAVLGRLLLQPLGTCALIGMSAFLSGTIQAPITSFVIIFEMTGHHEMLPPLMLASLLAFMLARVTKTPRLYETLAGNYRQLLDKSLPSV